MNFSQGNTRKTRAREPDSPRDNPKKRTGEVCRAVPIAPLAMALELALKMYGPAFWNEGLKNAKPANARSGQRLFRLASLPFPFIVLTQARLVLFDLGR